MDCVRNARALAWVTMDAATIQHNVREVLAELPAGADPCGENGEFHTFVSAGPMLAGSIAIRLGERGERDGFTRCDLLPA